MKKIILSTIFLITFSLMSFAQEVEKTVSITVSGNGITQDEAKQSALRSAIQQAYGAFISSKTEILNDQVVADQMVSVSSGNIQSFSLLNESQLPDGRWANTIKAIISVSKLASFVESKGISIDVKGGLFATNIKQQMLNEQGEINAIAEMVSVLYEAIQISFDYTIKSGEPRSVDVYNKNWEIPLEVTTKANKNMDFCARYCIKILESLSLSTEEVLSYQSLNKSVYPINIDYKKTKKTFFLRKELSFLTLMTISNHITNFTRLFTVRSGMDEMNGRDKWKISQINFEKKQEGEYPITKRIFKDEEEEEQEEKDEEGNNYKTIKFFVSGETVENFSLKDNRTLAQIEKMTGYTIKPQGLVSRIKNGGFVIYEKDGHGLVTSIVDLGKMSWESANYACDELVLNGYSDWSLPTRDELDSIHAYLYLIGEGGFLLDSDIPICYWPKKETNPEDKRGLICFERRKTRFFPMPDELGGYGLVRAVRKF